MNTSQLNQRLIICQRFTRKTLKGSIHLFTYLLALCWASASHAQNVEQVRWKGEAQVRDLYGEPQSVTAPVGTHATYKLWKYDDFTVAFANSKAFHLFKNDSLRKIKIEENRE